MRRSGAPRSTATGGRSRPPEGRGAASTRWPVASKVLRGFLDEAGRPRDFHLVYQSALWFSDHTSDKLPLTGPPHEIAASLGRLSDLGVTMVDLAVFGPGEVIATTAERFAAAVRPLL